MKRSRVAVLSALLIFVAAACGGSENDGEERPESTPMRPSESAESEDVDPFAPNVGDRALTVGEKRDGQLVDMTLAEIRYPYPPAEFREAQPGNVYVGLRLKQCLNEDSVDEYSTNVSEWYVVSPRNEEYTGGTSYIDFPQPRFPETVTLTADRCLKGWLTVEVPEDTRIKAIIYRPLGETVAEWLPPDGSNA